MLKLQMCDPKQKVQHVWNVSYPFSPPLVNRNSKGRRELPFVTRGPFLESPGNFSGQKSIIQIKMERIKPPVIGNKPVHFLLLNDTWISPDYCKRDVESKQQQLSGSVNYWDVRETGLKDKTKNDCPLNELTDEYSRLPRGGVHRNAGFLRSICE